MNHPIDSCASDSDPQDWDTLIGFRKLDDIGVLAEFQTEARSKCGNVVGRCHVDGLATFDEYLAY